MPCIGIYGMGIWKKSTRMAWRIVLGEYFADLFVESKLIVELKACKALAPEHTAQLLGYLRACYIEHGLLINFGTSKLQIKKYVLSDRE
jgi:GxxExxY protein